MGDPFCSVSVAPRGSKGPLFAGNPIDFSSPYPQGSTTFIGGDVALGFCPISPSSGWRVGQLAVRYMRGDNTEEFTQDALPPPLNSFPFTHKRVAKSHLIFGEARWRWPSAALYSSGRFALIDPWYGVGTGAMYTRTVITTTDGTKSVAKDLAVFVTGAIQGDLVRVSWDNRHWSLALQGAVRLYAGDVSGIGGEVGLALTYQWSHPQ